MSRIDGYARLIPKVLVNTGEVGTVPYSGYTGIYSGLSYINDDHTSLVGGYEWTKTDLYRGEICINEVDERIFFRSASGIVEVLFSGSTMNFTSLTDTPLTYLGSDNYLVQVNESSSALTFVDNTEYYKVALSGDSSNAYYLNPNYFEVYTGATSADTSTILPVYRINDSASGATDLWSANQIISYYGGASGTTTVFNSIQVVTDAEINEDLYVSGNSYLYGNLTLGGVLITGITSSSALTDNSYSLVTEGDVYNYVNSVIDGVVAGNDTEIQFNNSGSFGASSAFVYDGTDVILSNDDITTTYGIEEMYIDAFTDGFSVRINAEEGIIQDDGTGNVGSRTPVVWQLNDGSYTNEISQPLSLTQTATQTFPNKTGTVALTSDFVPAGSDTEIQYNDSGSFGSSEYFLYDATNIAFTLAIRSGETGQGSFCIGNNAVASNLFSFAHGTSKSTNQYSFAIGETCIASGIASFAGGNTAIGSSTNSFSFGNNTIASGTYSTSLNIYTEASGSASFAINNHTLASGDKSFAGGSGGASNKVISSGIASFNYSTRNVTTPDVSGVTGDYSAILGGQDHSCIHENSVILGGSGITSAADNTVYMENQEIIGSGNGIIMASPDGTRYKLTIANGGTVNVAAV